MKIRLTDNVAINVRMTADAGDIKLPPLLFIPFVENIFKHGVSYREPSVIDIALEVNDGGMVVFRSRNSNHAKKNGDSHHGIGLENLRRRLDLLYGDSYRLVTDDGKNIFYAEPCSAGQEMMFMEKLRCIAVDDEPLALMQAE